MQYSTLASLALLGALLPAQARQQSQPSRPIFFAQIELRGEAMAAGHWIRLRDIASVKSPDPQWTEALQNMEIARPPQEGNFRTLTQREVVGKLLAKGQARQNLKIKGARETFVRPHTATVTALELSQAAQRVLDKAILEETDSDIRYQLQRTPDWIKIPFGRRNRSLRPVLVGGKLGTNHAAIKVELLVDGKLYRTVRLNYSLTRYIKVLALSRTVRRGERLDRGALMFKRIEATHGSKDHVTSLKDVAGKASNARLVAGSLLRAHQLMRPILIRKHDIITLRIRGTALRITTEVKALEEGAVGDFIQVAQQARHNGRRRNRDKDRRVLHAKVVSKGLVEINQL